VAATRPQINDGGTDQHRRSRRPDPDAVGTFAGGAPMARLPRVMGRGRALGALLGSNDVRGAAAELLGYVNRALPDGELDNFVHALATRIASFDKLAGAGRLGESTRIRRRTAGRLTRFVASGTRRAHPRVRRANGDLSDCSRLTREDPLARLTSDEQMEPAGCCSYRIAALRCAAVGPVTPHRGLSLRTRPIPPAATVSGA